MTFFSVPFPIFVGNNYSGNSADAPLCSRLNALFERRMVFSVSMYFRRLDIYLRVISSNALEKFGEVRNFAAFYWLAREKERERERERNPILFRMELRFCEQRYGRTIISFLLPSQARPQKTSKVETITLASLSLGREILRYLVASHTAPSCETAVYF